MGIKFIPENTKREVGEIVSDQISHIRLEQLLLEIRKITIMLLEMSGLDIDQRDFDTRDEL